MLEARIAGQRIRDAWCKEDPIVVVEATPQELVAALRNARVSRVRRKGKWLVLDLEGPARAVQLLAHFGMTGSFALHGTPAPSYENFRVDTGTWPPKFAVLTIEFGAGIWSTLLFPAFEGLTVC